MTIADAYADWAALEPRPAPALPVLPATVWVAVVSWTKAVQVSNNAAITPLAGGPQAIFNRPSVQMEQVNTAEVIAVRTTQELALAAAHAHKAAFPNMEATYTVTEHGLDHAVEDKPVEVQVTCVGGCGTVLTNGQVFCEPCRQKQWANSGWRPEGKEEQ